MTSCSKNAVVVPLEQRVFPDVDVVFPDAGEPLRGEDGTEEAREKQVSGSSPEAVVWLTGPPSAGRTTIAYASGERRRGKGHPGGGLDGGEMRALLSAVRGLVRQDRRINVRRIGFGPGLLALVTVPYAHSRQAVRGPRAGTGYLDVHVAAPVEVCSAAEVKGLYTRQAAGGFLPPAGADAPYKAAQNPVSGITARRQAVQRPVTALHALLTEREYGMTTLATVHDSGKPFALSRPDALGSQAVSGEVADAFTGLSEAVMEDRQRVGYF